MKQWIKAHVVTWNKDDKVFERLRMKKINTAFLIDIEPYCDYKTKSGETVYNLQTTAANTDHAIQAVGSDLDELYNSED
jgi:hypothetical protein